MVVVLFRAVGYSSSVSIPHDHINDGAQSKEISMASSPNPLKPFNNNSNSLYYNVKAPMGILNDLSLVTGLNGTTRMAFINATLVSLDHRFAIFAHNVTLIGIKERNVGLYNLVYYFNTITINLTVNGENGYNYTFTNNTGTPIARYVNPTVNLENATISLLTNGQIFREYSSTPSLHTTSNSSSVDPINCPGCPPDTREYINTVTFKTTTTNLFDIPITITIVYSPSGIISGQIEVESDYSITYYSPLISITEELTDSLGFDWQIGLPITTTSSTNTHSYTHQDTTISFKLTFEYQSPLQYNGQYYYYYDVYSTYGIHITVPILT